MITLSFAFSKTKSNLIIVWKTDYHHHVIHHFINLIAGSIELTVSEEN